MDESSNRSHLFPNVLTQDDSPQTINEVIDGGLTMRSVLDNFVLTGDMSPSVTAPFVTCAVNRMDKTEIQNKSPARKLLYRRHQLLDGDTTMTDSEREKKKKLDLESIHQNIYWKVTTTIHGLTSTYNERTYDKRPVKQEIDF